MQITINSPHGTSPNHMKAVYRKKTKMVSFRISPEEYRQLCDACSARGLPSVSELARAAMHHLISSPVTSSPAGEQIRLLRDRLNTLCNEVERLACQVDEQAATEAFLAPGALARSKATA